MRGCGEDAIMAKDDLGIAWFVPAYAASRLLMRYGKGPGI